MIRRISDTHLYLLVVLNNSNRLTSTEQGLAPSSSSALIASTSPQTARRRRRSPLMTARAHVTFFSECDDAPHSTYMRHGTMRQCCDKKMRRNKKCGGISVLKLNGLFVYRFHFFLFSTRSRYLLRTCVRSRSPGSRLAWCDNQPMQRKSRSIMRVH